MSAKYLPFMISAFFLVFQSCSGKEVLSPEQAKKRFIKAYEKHVNKQTPKIEILHDIYSSKHRGFVGVKALVRGQFEKKEALELFSNFFKDYRNFVQESPLTKHFYSKELQKPEISEIVLTFWTDEMDRPGPEFASEIRLQGGIVTYFHRQVGSEFLDLNDTMSVAYYDLD